MKIKNTGKSINVKSKGVSYYIAKESIFTTDNKNLIKVLKTISVMKIIKEKRNEKKFSRSQPSK